MAKITLIAFQDAFTNTEFCVNLPYQPEEYDEDYTRLTNYIKEIKTDSAVRNELLELLPPLLCHICLEMINDKNVGPARALLKKHTAALLEINKEILDKHIMKVLLDEIGRVNTIREIKYYPLIDAFRYSTYIFYLSKKAVKLLSVFLKRGNNYLLIQALFWFRFYMIAYNKKLEDDEEDSDDEIGDTYVVLKVVLIGIIITTFIMYIADVRPPALYSGDCIHKHCI